MKRVSYIVVIFFTSCSSNLSISSLDTVMGLLNSISNFLSIFYFLSFNSLSFKSIKSFSNPKIVFFIFKIGYFAYFLSIFSQYFPSYSLGLPTL